MDDRDVAGLARSQRRSLIARAMDSRSAAPTRSTRRCSAAASACPTRTSPNAAACDPRRLALAALVALPQGRALQRVVPARLPRRPARDHSHGEELAARVEVNRGGPGNPLSDEELARKLHDNAVGSLPEERAAELAALTLAEPGAQSVEDLAAMLTSAGER